MAVITRIELVNYLSEGWQPSMGASRWRPLWPANTIRLAGQSTAIQIPNGCGKTSVTNAILFLLSRDRHLKKEFLDRCAPTEAGYTHVRIEFAIRTDENITQRELITLDPLECPAQTYVIGVCANRGEDELPFYRYPGTLEDVPAYSHDSTGIVFTPNEPFRQCVKRAPRADWNRWSTIAEWSKVVGEFMSPEVVRQNVVFHRSGAGDASATFKKVTVRPGESFDEAYFRQVAAPQLLSNLMGDSAEEDERAIEDTIVISMTRFIDAKLKVEHKQTYLERRDAMQTDFAPVLDAANAIHATQIEYQRQLMVLGQDASFLDRFAGTGNSTLTGVPLAISRAHAPPDIKQYLTGVSVDKDGSVVIRDETLAELLGQTTGNLNKAAETSSTLRGSVPAAVTSTQLIDFERNIKIYQGAGGRRKAVRYYERQAALELARRRENTDTAPFETVSAVFDIAEHVLDTNPFRREFRKLISRRQELRIQVTELGQTAREAEALQLSLEMQVTERAENQAVYQEFCRQAELLPDHLRAAPKDAEAWLDEAMRDRNAAISKHSERVGKLSAGWCGLLALRNELGLQSLPERLEELEAQKEELDNQQIDARAALDLARRRRDEQTSQQAESHRKLDQLRHELESLGQLALLDVTFHRLFGDVDPQAVSPPIDELKLLQGEYREKADTLSPQHARLATLTKLRAGMAKFYQLFGEIDPYQANPRAELANLNEAHRVAELAYSQHQPLAEMFAQHMERHAIEPQSWLSEADAKRRNAERKVQKATDRIEYLQRQFDSLEDLSLVDDSDCLAALSTLSNAHVPFVRARDLILESEPDKERCLSLLSALGSVLSAPVVPDISAAEAAMRALVDRDSNVPILLQTPLLEAIHAFDVTTTATGAALTFIAGAQTRRVRAIVDPNALEAEKCNLREQLQQECSICEQAQLIAAEYGPENSSYQMAVQAAQAVRQRSVAMAQAASSEMSALHPQIVRAQKLATDDALHYLNDAREFAALGGDVALDAVTAGIDALSADIAHIRKRIESLELVTTRDAVVAHDGALKFIQAGGNARVGALSRDVELLAGTYDQGILTLAECGDRLDNAQRHLDGTFDRMQNFLHTYTSLTGNLKDAIEFEAKGDAQFMATKDDKAQELEVAREKLKPLGRINFARAQSYKDHEDEDDTELQRRIGETRRIREQAADTTRGIQLELEKLEGLVYAAERSAETLHELAHILISKYLALAPYLVDLAQREGGATPPEAHALYGRSEDLRHRLADWSHTDGPFDRTLLSVLRQEIEEIDVAKIGGEAREAQKRVDRARETFRKLRDDFCSRATDSDVSALSRAEIEAIQAANTADQLRGLFQLGERLREELAREHEELRQLQESASTVESESIDTLARLVESCRMNLATMNAVMSRNPNARFFLDTTIISGDDIRKLMVELRNGIEERKRTAESKKTLGRKDTDEGSIKADVRQALIERIFTEPSVLFRHVGMWDGETRPIQPSLSEGQKAALQMMWLIKESEYHLECAIRRHLGGGSKKKLRDRSQRILFFDGLFSNLTDRALIDEAFKGLGETGSNLQLIGLIHNPEYRNNPAIFPSLVIGRRAGWREVEGERSFVRFDDQRPNGSLGFATFISKRPGAAANGEVPHG